MSVRAKFKVSEIKVDGEQRTIRAHAVYEENGVNKEWCKWTPCGNLDISITNPAAYEQFRVGQYIYIDFSEVPEGE